MVRARKWLRMEVFEEKTSIFFVRVKPGVKQRAGEVLSRLGIQMSTEIDMYLNHIEDDNVIITRVLYSASDISRRLLGR